MSYSKEISLFCEICGNWERFQTGKISTARRLAKIDLKWVYRNKQDLCQYCSNTETRSGD